MTGRIKKKSFRAQIMKAILVLIVGLLILFLLLFQGIKEIVVEQYSEAAKQSVQATADNIDYTLSDVENLSNSILTNHDLISSLKAGEKEQFISTLNSYFISSFHIEGIYTLSANGYQYVGANIKEGEENFPLEKIKKTFGEIIWFPTKEEHIQILSGYISKNYFSMGRKMIDVNSLEELGYMNITLDESVIEESYVNLEEAGSEIFVCDSQGNLISSNNKESSIQSILEHEYMKVILEDDTSDYVGYRENGQDYVAIYSSLNHNNWKIVKTIPKNLLYKEINRIQVFALAGSCGFLGIMFLIAYFYSKGITKPITEMMKQMKKVEAGNLDVRVETNVNNELDDLSESFNQMVYRIKTLMDEVVSAERNKNELELEVLHAQINPHFLYNTLNTIRWMAKIKNENSISDAIVALVKLLRVSISLGKNKITLREEIEYIENYLLIQKLRFNQMFEISYAIDEKHNSIYIPKLILQPIVENSLIYGIDEAEETEEILKINIFTKEEGDYIEIIVEDNGPGIEADILTNLLRNEKNINRFNKVGLNNVNQRLKMYFGNEYGLDIVSVARSGTKVVIKIPNHINGT